MIKITSLATLPDLVLLVGFNDGTYKVFDIKSIMNKYEQFRALTEIKGLYENAKIDLGGYGVVWNDDLDISAEGLYEKGLECNVPKDFDKKRAEIVDLYVSERKKANISQKQLEILSGIPQPSIARIEKGINDPKFSTLLRLLKPLGLTLKISKL